MAEVENQNPQQPNPMQPGQLITPGGAAPAPSQEPQAPPVSEPTAPSQPSQPVLPEQPAQQAPEAPASAPNYYSEPLSSWDGGADEMNPANVADDSDAITWTASEYIAHHKGMEWYLGLAAVSVLGAGLLWLLTRDVITAIVVLVCGLAFGAYAGRQPRTLTYVIDHSGLSIGDRHLLFEMFKSFAIVPEGAFSSVVLTPLKRFAPLTTLYYPPEQEDNIVAHLAIYLPMEERKQDFIDRLMYRIRF